MSRSTQFIGLSFKALDYVATLEEFEEERYTYGMAGEEVPLKTWKDTKRGWIVREQVQTVPWSSGPMIFTFLEVTFENGCVCSDVLSWVLDPQVENEVDSKEGTFWV